MQTAFSGAAFAAFKEFATQDPDYDKLKEVANSIVPFGKLAGVRIIELTAEHAIAEVPDSQDVKNHVDTVHAAAMYLAADFAGAVAVVGAAPAHGGQVEWMVVRGGHSTFLKPAIGRIRAVGTVDERDIGAITSRSGPGKFDIDGRALLYDDDDVLVAKFYFNYACQLAAPAAQS
jgi:acyl-coenzyme A thioesterase PaaI-like protein